MENERQSDLSDYARFRALLREHIEDMDRISKPEILSNDPLYRAYKSETFFNEYFSDPKELKDLLNNWEEIDREAEWAVAEIHRLIDDD